MKAFMQWMKDVVDKPIESIEELEQGNSLHDALAQPINMILPKVYTVEDIRQVFGRKQ